MPERKENQVQTSKQGEVKWWVPLLIGIMMLFIPGGVYATPIMILLAVLMRRRKPKSPETSPYSLLPLINITP